LRRAHLLEIAGEAGAAITHDLIAAGPTTSAPERNYLTTHPPGSARAPPPAGTV